MGNQSEAEARAIPLPFSSTELVLLHNEDWLHFEVESRSYLFILGSLRGDGTLEHLDFDLLTAEGSWVQTDSLDEPEGTSYEGALIEPGAYNLVISDRYDGWGNYGLELSLL